MEVILKMSFLIFNNIDFQFAKKDLTWKSYTAAKALSITKQIELINKKVFAKAELDENVGAFIIHMTFFSLSKLTILIYPARKAQIASLIAKEIKILVKFSDFSNVFSEKKALILPEITELN